jgi:hypothetical protein
MSSKPQIDINAKREDISKFIKENKLNIRITDGKKKRTIKELRDDLEKGGYALKGVSSVKKGGRPATTLKGMRKVVEREKVKREQKAEAQVGITLMGFSSDTQPISTNVSSLEVEMSGRGGIPIQAPAPAPAPAPAKQRILDEYEYQGVTIYEDQYTGEIFLNKEATIFLGLWDVDVENIDMTPQGRIEFEKLLTTKEEIDDDDLEEEFEDSEEERQIALWEQEQEAEDKRRKEEASKMKGLSIENLINIAAREKPDGGKYTWLEMMRAHSTLLDAGIRVPTPVRWGDTNLGIPGKYPIPSSPKGRERR